MRPDLPTGLPTCSRSAAKSRLQLVLHALSVHEGVLPGTAVQDALQQLRVYIHAQHTSVHTEELGKVAGQLMEGLLPALVEAMMQAGLGGSAPAHLAGLASAKGLMDGLFKPMIKAACR